MVTVTGLPGIAAVIALIFTFATVRQAQDTLNVTEQGQITDRYNDAVANLGSDTVDTRLGGIYALQRIMTDSARDQPTVIRVLSAFIRVHAPASDATKHQVRWEGPAPDITAALEVLATRRPFNDGTALVDLHSADLRGVNLPRFQHGEYTRTELAGADLREVNFDHARLNGANLNGAHLAGANLGAANFSGARLVGAYLRGADIGAVNFSDADLSSANLDHVNAYSTYLNRANLSNANLSDAVFVGANFSNADLNDTDLENTSLSDANLQDAHLTGAHLENTSLKGARLYGADLAEARSLTVEQVVSGFPYPSTKLPKGLALDPQVRARIAEIVKG
ncbi:pentapeptide repeat-containing protein [Streptomyces sp. QTS52]